MSRTSAARTPAAAVALFAVACGATAPPPAPKAKPPAPKDPAWLEPAARACARVASCTRTNDARWRDPSECFEWWIASGEPEGSLKTCLTKAGSCADVEVCMRGGGDPRVDAFCKGRRGVVSGCAGDLLVSCGAGDAEASAVDCAAMDATCREVRSPAGLAMRGCFSPSRCPAGAPAVRCEGDAVVSCRDGAIERVACPPGTRCEARAGEGGEPTATCRPRGQACGALATRRCEGDRLVTCAGHALGAGAPAVHVSDCVGLGLRCSGSGPRAACSVRENVECDRDMLPKCDGGSIVFCAAGRRTKISCASLGMGACDPSARGAVAACSGELARRTPDAPDGQ